MSERTLVLGIGNVLAGDDGIGARVAACLAAELGHLPPHSEVIDGGTCGLVLLRYLAGVRTLVAVDATELDAPPGTVRVLRGADIGAVFAATHLSTHQAGLADLLVAARLSGCLPERVSLVGVQPDRMTDMTLDLSASVADAFDECCQAVIVEAWTARNGRGRGAVPVRHRPALGLVLAAPPQLLGPG